MSLRWTLLTTFRSDDKYNPAEAGLLKYHVMLPYVADDT